MKNHDDVFTGNIEHSNVNFKTSKAVFTVALDFI